MKTFIELRKINVNDHTEKKGRFTYLSWTWAVDQLLENDPSATVAIRSNYYVSKIDETITVFYSTLYEANTNITNVLANSLGNLAFTPADVRAMQAVLERGAGETIDLLYSLQYIEQKIAYGAYRYVKASVR